MEPLAANDGRDLFFVEVVGLGIGVGKVPIDRARCAGDALDLVVRRRDPEALGLVHLGSQAGNAGRGRLDDRGSVLEHLDMWVDDIDARRTPVLAIGPGVFLGGVRAVGDDHSAQGVGNAGKLGNHRVRRRRRPLRRVTRRDQQPGRYTEFGARFAERMHTGKAGARPDDIGQRRIDIDTLVNPDCYDSGANALVEDTVESVLQGAIGTQIGDLVRPADDQLRLIQRPGRRHRIRRGADKADDRRFDRLNRPCAGAEFDGFDAVKKWCGHWCPSYPVCSLDSGDGGRK